MVSLATIVEIAIDGIGLGVLWALLGAGITLVFGMGEVLNLSQGVLAVIGAAAAFEVVRLGFGIYPAVVASLLFMAVFSLAIDRILLSSVYRSEGEERILVAIFVTVGLLLMLEGLLMMRYVGNMGLPGGFPSLHLGSATIRGSSLLNIVVGVIVIPALFVYLNYTASGIAARTIADDEIGAQLCGIDVRAMRSVIFVLSGVLAGIAGLLYAIGTTTSVSSAFNLTVFALIVSIVGGVRDIRGTIAAGVGLGVVFSFANFFIGSYVAMIILFGAVMLTVAIKQEDAL